MAADNNRGSYSSSARFSPRFKGARAPQSLPAPRESEFYDTYRRLLDSPDTFGADEESQLKKYFEEVELIRMFVRNAETDSLPMIEDMHVDSSTRR